MRRVQAFVAMPFNPKFHPVWKTIRRACEKNNIVPVRVDQLPLIDDIHKTIFSEIEHSDIIIVDFSGDKVLSVPNPNVVTEATHAKGLRKPIIILTQSTDALPFDWRTHRAVVYENNQEGLEYLAEVLEENLGGIKSRLSGEVKIFSSKSVFEDKIQEKKRTISFDGRYRVLTSGSVYDSKANLEWIVGIDKDTSWEEANVWGKSIDTAKYGTGWRMPTKQELKGIYEKGKGECNIDNLFLPPRKDLHIWSGESIYESQNVWYFDFHDGKEHWANRIKRYPFRVFLVRPFVSFINHN